MISIILSSPKPFLGRKLILTSRQVTWNGDKDPDNPYNWPTFLRWTVSILTSLGGFVTLMSGSMIAPALPDLQRDFHMSAANAQVSLSIFVLAFGFGPLFLAPFSEIYGRRPVWLICGVWYSAWNIVAGFAKSRRLLIATRLLAGFGGSVDFVIAFPVRSDVWRPEERGKSFAIAGFLPLLGPAIGPLIGGAITEVSISTLHPIRALKRD
jgi:MFS family permease